MDWSSSALPLHHVSQREGGRVKAHKAGAAHPSQTRKTTVPTREGAGTPRGRACVFVPCLISDCLHLTGAVKAQGEPGCVAGSGSIRVLSILGREQTREGARRNRTPNKGMPQGAVCHGPQPPPLQRASLPQPTLYTGLGLWHSGDKTAPRQPIAGTGVTITSDWSGKRPDQRGRNPARHSRRPPWQRSSTCTTPTSTSTSGCPEDHGAAAASAGHPLP